MDIILSITIVRYGQPVRFDYNEEDGLFHFEGDLSYTGYELDELLEMDEVA